MTPADWLWGASIGALTLIALCTLATIIYAVRKGYRWQLSGGPGVKTPQAPAEGSAP